MAVPAPKPFPAALLGFSRSDVQHQQNAWRPTPFWRSVLGGHPALLDALVDEMIEHHTIRRVFVHERAQGNPVELFLAAMAWGFGTNEPRFPVQRNMLCGPGAAAAVHGAKIASIVQTTQNQGAGSGWHDLLVTNKIPGLNMSYGTKLLYFAGYTAASSGPRPLILDDQVRSALVRLAPGTLPPGPRQVRQAHYQAYLELAETWAGDPRWNESPEVVEFALYTLR